MRTNSLVFARILVLAVFLLGTMNAWSKNTLLGGMFKGDEPAIISLSGWEPCQGPLGYQQIRFQVSAKGDYQLHHALDNLYGLGAVGVFTQVYRDAFNPAAIGQNVVIGRDYYRYLLDSGVTYILVVQQGCGNQEGPWAIWFNGPGVVSSQSVLAVPDVFEGRFTSSDPTMSSECSPFAKSHYHQSGPIRVSRDGPYYFSDTSMKWSIGVCLQVYTAPVNPANPNANRVGYATYGQPRIELEAGRDYYFVTQNIGGQTLGDFLYVLAPPAPFRMNSGLAGSWYNPQTPGQGFFLGIYERINQVFLAWFTYANAPSAEGDFAHRWMTALGPFDGTSAQLDIDWTANGAFDAALPEPERFRDGAMHLEFSDCSSGEIRYAWDGDGDSRPAASGVIPIRRIADDALALCESLYRTPGVPGPL